MNRSATIVLLIVAVIVVLAEAPPALGRLLIYALVFGAAIYALSLLAAQARDRRPPRRARIRHALVSASHPHDGIHQSDAAPGGNAVPHCTK